MYTTFQDLQRVHNPRNGQVVNDRSSVLALLAELQKIQPPFMCQFVGDNGFNLTVGIDHDCGCVQHSPNDGTATLSDGHPALVASSRNGIRSRRHGDADCSSILSPLCHDQGSGCNFRVVGASAATLSNGRSFSSAIGLSSAWYAR